MKNKSKCIYYATIGLSFLFTVRTYRVLYSGLFRSVTIHLISGVNNKNDDKNMN